MLFFISHGLFATSVLRSLLVHEYRLFSFVWEDGVFQDLRVEFLERQVVLVISSTASTAGSSLILMECTFTGLCSLLVDRNHDVLMFHRKLGSSTSDHSLKHVVHKLVSWWRRSSQSLAAPMDLHEVLFRPPSLLRHLHFSGTRPSSRWATPVSTDQRHFSIG